MKVSIVIEHDESGYYAFAPELPGCHTQGESFEEAKANIAEAIDLYLSTLDYEDRSEIGVQEVWSSALEFADA
jgi:predicted RNase H-like HicB family nuclease